MAVWVQYFAVAGLLGYNRARLTTSLGGGPGWAGSPAAHAVLEGLVGYSVANLLIVSLLFWLQARSDVLGKSRRTGQVPWWSFAVFWPFHGFNMLAMYVKALTVRRNVAFGTEVLPGLWIGGWFTDRVPGVQRWRAVLDLTTEFSERADTDHYLCLPVWDGNPPSPAQLEQGARFLSRHHRAAAGATMCHCAFGIGRSTTMLCAALIYDGHADTVEAALALIKEKRPIVRLNAKMRRSLALWVQQRQPKPQAPATTS